MPVIRLPTLMQHYTEKQNDFAVPGRTALEAVRAAADRFPALRGQLFDHEGRLRRHISLFVNDLSVSELDGAETEVARADVIRILPAISGG